MKQSAVIAIAFMFLSCDQKPKINVSSKPDINISIIAHLHSLVTAEEQYKATSGSNCYGSLAQLSSTNPPYFISSLESDKQNGYAINIQVGTPSDKKWFAVASPIGINSHTSVYRSYYVDQSGIIRINRIGLANSSDSPIQ